jgi:hypothetical protein
MSAFLSLDVVLLLFEQFLDVRFRKNKFLPRIWLMSVSVCMSTLLKLGEEASFGTGVTGDSGTFSFGVVWIISAGVAGICIGGTLALGTSGPLITLGSCTVSTVSGSCRSGTFLIGASLASSLPSEERSSGTTTFTGVEVVGGAATGNCIGGVLVTASFRTLDSLSFLQSSSFFNFSFMVCNSAFSAFVSISLLAYVSSEDLASIN